MRKTVKYRKLVRDKIPDKIKNDPDVIDYTFVPMDMDKFPKALADKVVEEAKEVAEALVNYTTEANSYFAVLENEEKLKAKVIEEVGDLLDVIKVLRESYDIKKEDVKAARKKKNKEFGGFDNGYFLDSVVRRTSWKLK